MVHAGVVSTVNYSGNGGTFSVRINGVAVARDLIPGGSRAYVGANGMVGNGVATVTVELESWPSQETRVSLVAQVIKR